MSGFSPNFPYLSLPIAAGLAYAPHFVKALVAFCAAVDACNGISQDAVNPRGQLDKAGSRMTKTSADMANRAENAHTNGLETLPLFYGAVLASLHAGIPRDTISYYASMFLVSRVFYNIIYILNTNRISSLARTSVWGIGMFSCLKLFITAARK